MKVAIATRPASAAEPNEDFIAATPQAVAVLDGASIPPDLETGCQHGTPWFVTELGMALLCRLTGRSPRTLADALAEAIEEVAAIHADTCDLNHPGTPSAAVALLREQADTIEYLVLADCTVVLDCSGEIEAITDDRIDHVAQAERAAALRLYQASSGAQYAEPLSRLVSVQRAHRNRPDGFWVASTDPTAAYQAIVGSRPRDQLRRAAIMTDGAANLVDRFQLATWPEVLSLLERRGPSVLIDRVRGAEASDPQGKRWRRSKQHDDATVAICRFDPEVMLLFPVK
jgi:hypothetical protein